MKLKQSIVIGIAVAGMLGAAGCCRQCAETTETACLQPEATYRVLPPVGKIHRHDKMAAELRTRLEEALQREGIAGGSGWTVQPRIIDRPGPKSANLAVEVDIRAPDGTPRAPFVVRCWDARDWAGGSRAVADEIAETLAEQQ